MRVGFIAVAFRIVFELIKRSLDPSGIWFKIGNINFLTFGAWFILFCILLIIVVSLLTKAPTDEKVKNLTFDSISDEEKQNNNNSYGWGDIAISVFIVIIVLAIMWFFNGK